MEPSPTLQAIAKLEVEKKESAAEISLCKSQVGFIMLCFWTLGHLLFQLNESRVADGKVDTLQLIIEQRDQVRKLIIFGRIWIVRILYTCYIRFH